MLASRLPSSGARHVGEPRLRLADVLACQPPAVLVK